MSESEKEVRSAELVLRFDVPEGVSDEEAARMVSEFVAMLDAFHRAKGGSGLKLAPDGVRVLTPLPQEEGNP